MRFLLPGTFLLSLNPAFSSGSFLLCFQVSAETLLLEVFPDSALPSHTAGQVALLCALRCPGFAMFDVGLTVVCDPLTNLSPCLGGELCEDRSICLPPSRSGVQEVFRKIC